MGLLRDVDPRNQSRSQFVECACIKTCGSLLCSFIVSLCNHVPLSKRLHLQYCYIYTKSVVWMANKVSEWRAILDCCVCLQVDMQVSQNHHTLKTMEAALDVVR